jgi:hypothetical protein
MNIRLFVNILKLLFIALGILILSSIFSAISSCAHASLSTLVKKLNSKIKPYKNISLKTVLGKNVISLNDDDIISQYISKPIKPLQAVKIIHVVKEKNH